MRIIKAASQPLPKSKGTSVSSDHGGYSEKQTRPHNSIDILGPHFCNVLEKHTPASEAIVKLVTKKVEADPDFKKAVKNVIDERNNETNMKWIERSIGVGGTIVLGLVIWGIEWLISGHSH